MPRLFLFSCFPVSLPVPSWPKPERQLRTLGMQPAGGSTSLFQSSLGARRRIDLRAETKSVHSSIVNLLGNAMEESTCVLWGGVWKRGGLKLREILYFPARRVEVYAGLILSFQTKISYSTGIYFTDFNKH